MSEVTTRPATRATKAPARQKTAPSTIPISAPSKRTVSEASCAAAEALTYVSFLMCEIVKNDEFMSEFAGPAELFNAAENQVAILAYGDEGDRPVEVTRTEIESLADALRAAMESLDAAAKDSPLGTPIAVAVLGHYAQELLARIADALEASPATLAPLMALSTYSGLRPHRDRPTPPIRRIDKDLKSALNVIATQASTLSGFLWHAKDTAEKNHDLRAANDFLVAQGLAEYIGVIADECTGSTYIGGALDWAEGGAA